MRIFRANDLTLNMIKLAMVAKVIKKSFQNVLDVKSWHEQRIKLNFALLLIAVRMRIKHKRYGPNSILDKHKGYMKSQFTFMQNIIGFGANQKAKEIFKEFLQDAYAS